MMNNVIGSKTSQAEKPEIIIIPYENRHRDDMLFCFLAAKDAICLSKHTPPEYRKPILK